MTAPTPERRVGEERLVPLAEMDFGVFYQVLDDARKADATLIRDLALDLLDERAANARLTAEVERLTKEKAEAMAVARELAALSVLGDEEWGDEQSARLNRAVASVTALSLPTPAPEVTE